jgi:hypothetical protein
MSDPPSLAMQATARLESAEARSEKAEAKCGFHSGISRLRRSSGLHQTKSPALAPGFSSRRLLAPPLARIQRQADRVGLLPHRAFGALEFGADAPRRRLLSRHCLERAKIALRPIAADSSPGSCHFHTLHLVGTPRCITKRGKSLSRSTNRVILREGSLIYAPEFIFWLARGVLGIDYGPNFCLRYVTSRTFRRQFGKILATVSNGPNCSRLAFDVLSCISRIDKPGTSTKILDSRQSTPPQPDVLVGLTAIRPNDEVIKAPQGKP